MAVPHAEPGTGIIVPQEPTSSLCEVKEVSGSEHKPSEPSPDLLYPHAGPWILSLQPAHVLPCLQHIIRGLRYQYLLQFFFPLLLFFEQLLQQVTKCLALLHDHPLQQKDSGIHTSSPQHCEQPPGPGCQQSTHPARNRHSKCYSPALRGPSAELSRWPQSSPRGCCGRHISPGPAPTTSQRCQPSAHPGQPRPVLAAHH